jgi:hypothetical protein
MAIIQVVILGKIQRKITNIYMKKIINMITEQSKMKFKINIMEILKTKKPLLKYIIHQEEKVTLFLDDT